MNHGEGLQILHYLPGQEYEPHYDWFDPEQPGFGPITAIGGQRIASVVMYLNTPEAGRRHGLSRDRPDRHRACAARPSISHTRAATASLHAGLPVIRGEKWIATKWLRERPYRNQHQR